MISWMELLPRLDFAVELLAAVLLLIAPLEKRPRRGLRLALGSAACLIVGVLAQMAWAMLWLLPEGMFPRSGNLSYLVWFTAMILIYLCPTLAAAVWLFRLCCPLTVREALYGTVCAYALQHLVHATTLLFAPQLAQQSGSSLPPVVWCARLLLLLVVYGAAYPLVSRKLVQNGRYQVQTYETLRTLTLVMAVAVILNLVAKGLYRHGNGALFSVCMLYDILCCLFVLWLQVTQQKQTRLQAEVLLERQQRQLQREQYEQAKQNIALINHKCHELKQQLAELRTTQDRRAQDSALAQLERSLTIYDAVVRTKNEVLDTLLTQQSLLCESEHIQWTCMADGEALAFMDPMDLYTLFGSALENAVEALRKVQDPERRVLAVTLQKQGALAFLQIENYCDTPPVFIDGVPRSTKDGRSGTGRGIRRIRSVVQQYDGDLQLEFDGSVFLLKVLLPIPDPQ